MAETKNGQQPRSFKRKPGNTTYTVRVHLISPFSFRRTLIKVHDSALDTVRSGGYTIHKPITSLFCAEIERKKTES